jgi:hypothetical protein
MLHSLEIPGSHQGNFGVVEFWLLLERLQSNMNHFDAPLRPIRQGTLRSAMHKPSLEGMGASSVTLSRVFM